MYGANVLRVFLPPSFLPSFQLANAPRKRSMSRAPVTSKLQKQIISHICLLSHWPTESTGLFSWLRYSSFTCFRSSGNSHVTTQTAWVLAVELVADARARAYTNLVVQARTRYYYIRCDWMQTKLFDVPTLLYLASYFLVTSDSKCTAHVCNLERICWL